MMQALGYAREDLFTQPYTLILPAAATGGSGRRRPGAAGTAHAGRRAGSKLAQEGWQRD
jgi:hypothetical protein